MWKVRAKEVSESMVDEDDNENDHELEHELEHGHDPEHDLMNGVDVDVGANVGVGVGGRPHAHAHALTNAMGGNTMDIVNGGHINVNDIGNHGEEEGVDIGHFTGIGNGNGSTANVGVGVGVANTDATMVAMQVDDSVQ